MIVNDICSRHVKFHLILLIKKKKIFHLISQIDRLLLLIVDVQLHLQPNDIYSIFRSLFIWRPKEDSEIAQQKDEKKIIVCGKAEKKLGKKSAGESDDSDDDLSKLKSKNSKPEKLDQDHLVLVLRASVERILQSSLMQTGV